MNRQGTKSRFGIRYPRIKKGRRQEIWKKATVKRIQLSGKNYGKMVIEDDDGEQFYDYEDVKLAIERFTKKIYADGQIEKDSSVQKVKKAKKEKK